MGVMLLHRFSQRPRLPLGNGGDGNDFHLRSSWRNHRRPKQLRLCEDSRARHVQRVWRVVPVGRCLVWPSASIFLSLRAQIIRRPQKVWLFWVVAVVVVAGGLSGLLGGLLTGWGVP